MKPYVFGVDIGGTTVKIGFFQTDGTLLKKWEVKSRVETNGEAILSDTAEAIAAELAERGLDKADIEGIGIGVPGAVLEQRIVNRCVNLGWGVVDVKSEMETLLDIPVRVGNDANVAALGEYGYGGGKDSRSMMLITLGTGIGGAVILDGKIIEGAFGAGGEIGHMHVNDEETRVCTCGNYGCLEQYASATGIARRAKALIDIGRETSLSAVEEPTAKDVFDHMKAGDALAAEVVEETAETLGKALAAASNMVDPEVFVIGGGVSKAGTVLTDRIQESFVKYAFHASKGARFALAQLGNDAGMYGAMQLML